MTRFEMIEKIAQYEVESITVTNLEKIALVHLCVSLSNLSDSELEEKVKEIESYDSQEI